MDIFERYREQTPTSQTLFNHAKMLFPGGVCHNLRGFAPHPFYPKSAKGATLTDLDGREMLDLWMGHYTLIFGHAFDEVKRAVGKVLDHGWHWGTPCEAEVRLADEICLAVPSMRKMRFCCTGTEATMYAVRLARAYTGRPWVLKVAGGWHGASSDLSFAVKAPFEGPEGPGLLDPETQGISQLAFNDIESSRKAFDLHRDHLAAVIVEPMLGSGGFIPADHAYLRFLREACDACGALLIFDEIITGFRFRYGALADEYGVRPDLTTLGKIIGGGFPIGAYGGREEIMALADPLLARGPGRPVLVGGGTFSANPVTMVAGLATLGALRMRGRELYPALAERGEKMRKGVEERFAAAGVPAACTGKGSMFMTHILKGQERGLNSPADIADRTRYEMKDKELRIALLTHGLFTTHGGGALSAAHGDCEVETMLGAYEKAAKDLKRYVE